MVSSAPIASSSPPPPELMAILALARDLRDLRARIGRIQLALDQRGKPITAEQLEVAGAVTVLLKDALKPTLMQTTEQTLCWSTPALANIAHGNSSVIADRMALGLADYVVTEAGFGSDMGLEKFFNIKYRQSGLAPPAWCWWPRCAASRPTAACSTSGRASRCRPACKGRSAHPDSGCANLAWHIHNARRCRVPVVVAINRFPTDSDAGLALLEAAARQAGACGVALSRAFTDGGAGAADLAHAVVAACKQPSEVRLLYPDEMSLAAKLATLVECGYGGRGITLSDKARASNWPDSRQRARITCPSRMAKTPLSISHDPARKGRADGLRGAHRGGETLRGGRLRLCPGGPHHDHAGPGAVCRPIALIDTSHGRSCRLLCGLAVCRPLNTAYRHRRWRRRCRPELTAPRSARNDKVPPIGGAFCAVPGGSKTQRVKRAGSYGAGYWPLLSSTQAWAVCAPGHFSSAAVWILTMLRLGSSVTAFCCCSVAVAIRVFMSVIWVTAPLMLSMLLPPSRASSISTSADGSVAWRCPPRRCAPEALRSSC